VAWARSRHGSRGSARGARRGNARAPRVGLAEVHLATIRSTSFAMPGHQQFRAHRGRRAVRHRAMRGADQRRHELSRHDEQEGTCAVRAGAAVTDEQAAGSVEMRSVPGDLAHGRRHAGRGVEVAAQRRVIGLRCSPDCSARVSAATRPCSPRSRPATSTPR
jgi:hypothetical protein